MTFHLGPHHPARPHDVTRVRKWRLLWRHRLLWLLLVWRQLPALSLWWRVLLQVVGRVVVGGMVQVLYGWCVVLVVLVVLMHHTMATTGELQAGQARTRPRQMTGRQAQLLSQCGGLQRP